MSMAELHDELRAVARDLLANPSWERMVAAGWTGLEVPEALDGSGATSAETAVVLEELGRACAATPFLGTVLAAVALGDDELAREAANGTRFAVALSASGDDAVFRPGFRLDAGRVVGEATFVLDAPDADRVLLVTDDQVVLAPVTVTEQPVLDATRRFGTVTADAEVEAAWPVDPQALLDRAAMAVAIDSLGLGHAMLNATVEYAKVRKQFDAPIGSFQAVKHQCADMLVQLTVGRELVLDGDARRAKAYLGQAGVDVVGTAMQLHGGIGYTWESGVHAYLKRATLNRSLFGSPAAHRRRLQTEIVAGSAGWKS
jgi:alkylation response protein AidB-like acyl-CoA dehydrogenase